MWSRSRLGLIILVLAVGLPLFLFAIRLSGQAPGLPRLKPGEQQDRAAGRNTADEIARIVRDQTGADKADAIVVGNIAVVGIDQGGGENTGAGRRELTRPPTGSVYILKKGTEAEIIKRYPFLVRVYSTDDPDTVSLIARLARDFRHRVPMDQRVDLVARAVKAASRPRGATGPTAQ